MVLLRDSSKDHFSLVLERANRTNGRSVRTVVGVGTVVQRDVLVAAEVQRVRVRRKTSAEKVRPVYDAGSRDPSAGRATLLHAGPGLGNRVEGCVDVRDQLVVDGVAVGPHVGRVDAV